MRTGVRESAWEFVTVRGRSSSIDLSSYAPGSNEQRTDTSDAWQGRNVVTPRPAAFIACPLRRRR
jgi:hypothetical protein